jgi:hypothetical protein
MFDALFVLAIPVLWALCFYRPGAACGLALSGFALEQCAQIFVPLFGVYGQTFNYVVAGGVVLALVRQLVRRGPRVMELGPAGWATILLLGYTALTVGWALFPSTTEASLFERLPFMGLFVLLAPHTVQDRRDIEDLFMVVVFGTAAALVPALLFGEWRGRALYIESMGHTGNPLALTQVGGNILIGGALTPLVKQKSGRAFIPVAVALATVVLVTFLRTQSRGQIVAALAVTVTLAAVVRGGRVWLVIGAIALTWILTSGVFEEELATNAMRWDRRQMIRSVEEDRIASALRLLEYWYEADPFYQIFGFGHAAAQDPRLLGRYPHVVPAEVLAEEGLVGIALYLAAIILAGRAYFRGLSEGRNLPSHAYFPAFFGLFTYEFILTLKQGTLTGATFFLMLLVMSDTVERCMKTAGPRKTDVGRNHIRRGVEGQTPMLLSGRE